ncbi:AHNK protein, partial [Calonectris borealis]|nr:AHNK protein [Calonectris borealis]
KTKFGISMPKRKEPATENTKPGSDVPHSGPETTAEISSEDGRSLGVKPHMPDAEPEVSTWKIQMPSFKMAKTPKADMKIPREESTVESADTVKKAQTEEDGMPTSDKTLNMDTGMMKGEKDIEGKESKFRLPKFKLPTFTWASTKDETGQTESQISDKEGKVISLEAGAKPEMSISAEEIKIPSAEIENGISKGKTNDKDMRQLPEIQLPSLKTLTVKTSSTENHLEETEGEILITKPDIEIKKGEMTISTKKKKEISENMTAAGEGPALGLKADVPGAKTEGAGWKVEKPSLKMPKADIKAPKVDISLPSVDVSLPKASVDLQAPEAALTLEGEAKAPEKEAAKSKDGKFKMPKFGMPSFGWSSSREAKGTVAADVDVSFKEPQVTVPSGTAEVDVTLPAAEIHAPAFEVVVDSSSGKEDEMGKTKSSVFRMPKVSLSKVVLDAPTVDVSLQLMEVTMPKLEMEIPSPDLGCKAEQEVVSEEKDTEEKENKFKTSKFKLPSFSWSPKKEAIAPSEVEGRLEEPNFSTLSGDTESELTFPIPENQHLHVEFDTSTEKDGEKGRNKKSQFIMPKISFPKIKGQKVQVSLPTLETDVCGPKQEKEGVSVQKSEKGSSAEGARMGIKMPKVTVPTLEFSKSEVKAPKIEMDISMPTGEVKSPDTNVERTSNEIAVGDVETKIEGPEGKTRMSKFQMPKFGITHSKGKGSEKEVSRSKSEVKVPQLKPMVEIADIALEAPNLEVECGTGTETYSPKVKTSEADNKASDADIHLPSADISIPKLDSDIQDSDAALKIKGEIKQDGDGEEKEGHFKMPKFKLPSFSWSPKKEASVKPDSGANLEDHKLAVMSSRIDTEVRGTATDDQGSGPALDLETSAGKVEQKSPTKKPQFVMPKISLSKIKVPKSQTHSPKVEADATIPKTEKEGDDSIQIPDIERSHSERMEEGAQISIKLPDVKIPTLEFSKRETGASQTEMGVSSAKIDAALPPSEGSFQQVVLKSSSTDEDTIQKTGFKFPKGEASIELRSPEIVTERSSVVDERKMKLEGPEGKIKMPKFQKPKFGISLTKGKGPDTEISSPKIEAELPQLKITNEIADIAVGVPASKLTSDMSDPVGLPKLGDSVKSSDVGLSKMEGDISLSTERTESRVNIPKTETYADIVKRGAEGQQMHSSEFIVPSAELSKSYPSASETDKDNSLTNRFPMTSSRITVETVDKSQGGPELNIKIPKLKIPRFTFKALPTEADVSVSKVVTDPKGSSTDIEV